MAKPSDLHDNISVDDAKIQSLLTNNLTGIEGLPYQFMETVDRRLKGMTIGRKYAEKIMARLPLLFLTPCTPKYMSDFKGSDIDKATLALLGEIPGKDLIVEGTGKFYSIDFDYKNYYNYLNPMLNSVAAFLGIYNKKLKIGGNDHTIGDMDWSKDTNDDFKTFFSGKENLVFYLDGMNSVSEQFSNDTTEPSLASQINGFTDMVNEINFLFGGNQGSIIQEAKDAAGDVSSSIMGTLSNLLGAEKIGGSIVGSLAESGVSTILNGGKIMFPEIWSNSTFSRSYNIDIKLRSPDNDSLSIFMNVLKPYCKILALTLPRLLDVDGKINPNGYKAPFLVKGYCKGLFNVDMGIISSLSVTKGAECCWNDDGLPTQIDLSVELKDLYNNLAMSSNDHLSNVVNNTAYMDFLANMAGLNIAQTEVGRKAKMYMYLARAKVGQTPGRVFTSIDQAISKFMGGLYDFTS